MDKAITTGIFIIASVVASIALINAVLPAIGDSSGALSAANASAADRIRTDIEIVHAAAGPVVGGEDQVLVWVKNIGSQKISPVESSDIFLTTATDFLGSDVSSPRNPHRGPAGGPDPADAICQSKW